MNETNNERQKKTVPVRCTHARLLCRTQKSAITPVFLCLDCMDFSGFLQIAEAMLGDGTERRWVVAEMRGEVRRLNVVHRRDPGHRMFSITRSESRFLITFRPVAETSGREWLKWLGWIQGE